MAKEKVLVAGSLVLDIVAAVDDGADTRMLFAEGKQTELKGVEMYLGGEVGNMGIALSKLGVPVTLVSKVGDDIGGRIIRDFLKSFPVSAAVKTVKNLKSTVSVCLTVPGKDKITSINGAPHRHLHRMILTKRCSVRSICFILDILRQWRPSMTARENNCLQCCKRLKMQERRLLLT